MLSVIFFLETCFVFSCVCCLSRIPDLGSSAIVGALNCFGFSEPDHHWPISFDEKGSVCHQELKSLALGFCPPGPSVAEIGSRREKDPRVLLGQSSILTESSTNSVPESSSRLPG